MFLDAESLRPVIISMALYIAIVYAIPRVIKKPVGVDLVDDLVMNIISQGDNVSSGAILVGIIVIATFYINEEFA
jgi:hypothetical protein